jgi:hypothetical protein
METTEQPTANLAGRPIGVWLVLACKLWSVAIQASALFHWQAAAHGYSLRALAFDVFTVADLVGAVALFGLRRMAPLILTVVLVATLVTEAFVGSLLPPSGSPLFRLAWFLYDLVGIGISTAAVAYAWHLRKRGVLC